MKDRPAGASDRDGLVLPQSFCDRDVVEVARGLLGKLLYRRTPVGLVCGRIVETEAYLAEDDTASHSARGKTRKNASMFGPPGCAYVYPIHARHCFNVVTQSAGVASAVLVRAVEPVSGLDLMRHRRGRIRIEELASGPAKLCEAFQIDRDLDGWDLSLGARLWLAAGANGDLRPEQIGLSQRIGVTSADHLLLRFYVRGNAFVSGPKRLRA